jgi:hypothetical protein
MLHNLISELRRHFFVVYVRPGISITPSSFSEDHNTIVKFDDRAVLSQYDDVLTFDDLAIRYHKGTKYNLLKNLLYANTYHFISAQGGGTYHCAMFSGSCIVVNHKAGEETRFAYAHGLYRHLSNPCPVMLIARNDDSFCAAALALRHAAVIADRIAFDAGELRRFESLIPAQIPVTLDRAIEYYNMLRFSDPNQRPIPTL